MLKDCVYFFSLARTNGTVISAGNLCEIDTSCTGMAVGMKCPGGIMGRLSHISLLSDVLDTSIVYYVISSVYVYMLH
jgi:hypothetical protein